jgi:FAD/FMN-containing dehydrogenase
MNANVMTSASGSVVAELERVLGKEHVSADEKTRDFYSRDLSFRPYQTAACVVRPGNLEELSAAVGAATRAGHAIVPRGGGMSYTSGYTPAARDSMLIDMRRMSAIHEINKRRHVRDRRVRLHVEGCSRR